MQKLVYVQQPEYNNKLLYLFTYILQTTPLVNEICLPFVCIYEFLKAEKYFKMFIIHYQF